MDRQSFLFLVANTPWVYALAEALAQNHPTHATRFYDWKNYFRLRPTWSSSSTYSHGNLQRTMRSLPPGYVGNLEVVFRPYLQWQVQNWFESLQKSSGASPWIIVPYPFSAPWVRNLPAERLIYYNLDEYIHYQPARKEKIMAQEAELVNRAAITLCIAQSQVETLGQRYPHQADKIHHFPLGVVQNFLNPEPEKLAEPMTVGYVGNLIERVDWKLVLQIAQGCPEVTFVFVGGLDDYAGEVSNPSWKVNRQAALSLPNVRHIGKVSQEQVTKYYWSFAINWIPYDVTHPFNQASCPTKVMDGIASGRPVISTDIPECRLYPDWIEIFDSTEQAIALIRQKLSTINTPELYQKSLQQLQFAQQQTWQARANTLATLLSRWA
ncbi:MAG: glycosyltransferase [Calothrix sp. MO_167.B42]|nr:glycosyltransferase [Calothrix sp. MO_167.B42]